ncbi:2-oxo acid dehydrogenase subunit E2 [Micromonospora tulbaghiae]|uniref:2-oxo acid dehydrogenase subunit E2 n=1 Tax=Micromonospora tulbaghiae TaxID=479978 RepID=UPI0033C72C5F
MRDLTIPRLNSNDDTYILLEWLVAPAGAVSAGDCVATIETSKAVSDLICQAEGYLVPAVPAGATCRPGDVVGHVAAVPPIIDATSPSATVAAPPPSTDSGRLVITRSAEELIDRHGIAAEALRRIGKKLIKAADVRALIDGDDATERMPLPPHQRAVARTVSRSHATIPSAFAMAKVSATQLTVASQRVGAQKAAFIGLPEFVISAVARLLTRFPACFGGVHDDLTVEPASRADIGVTIDVGTGLYIPVIRDAASLSVAEISARMMEFRVRAMRRTIRDSDLGPASLTISLQMEPGIVLSRPIVFPGQACTLVICAVQRELALGPAGDVREHDYFHIGAAYDHRVVNGSYAAAFLTALRRSLESDHPEGAESAVQPAHSPPAPP